MNTTVNTIIFSKNRAAQLDLLLRSIRQFCPHLFPVSVLWTASEQRFVEGYHKLFDQYNPRCARMREGHFKDDTIKLMTTQGGLGNRVCFLVDDDVFFRPVDRKWEFLEPGMAFAPRLGLNCRYCYMVDGPQRVPPTTIRLVGPPELNGDLDFDCTFSLDGHIYHLADILPFFEQADYANPNELEGELCGRIRFPLTFAPHSSLVGIPHNRVGPNQGNRCEHGSADGLNNRFLAGERLDWHQMDFSQVIGVHQNIRYGWMKASGAAAGGGL